MRKRLFLYFVLFEIIIIFVVVFAIFRRYQAPKISISPLNSNYLVFHPVDGLKYYYEPKPNSVQSLYGPFLQKLGYPANSEIKYTITKNGFNQRRDYSLKRPGNIYRIVTIGDSFTFGQNVNTEDNYPSQLEALLNKECTNKNTNKYQVINLGVGGYDIQYSVERYKIRGQKYNPDLVLWFIIGDDFKRIDEQQILESTLLQKQILDTQGYEANLEAIVSHESWIHARNEIISRFGGQDKVLEMQENFLNQLGSYYKGNLLLFTFLSTEKKFKDSLAKLSKSRGHTLFYNNLPNVYSKTKYRLKDGHPTQAGYTMIVQNLVNYMEKNKLISCDSQ